MKPSERIAQHIVSCHLLPAWKKKLDRITLRAGNIHSELGLRNRMPAVCSVLGSQRFQLMTGAELIDRGGPHNGANAVFTFRLK
jgi:5-methylcytosine-specific restriction protein B